MNLQKHEMKKGDEVKVIIENNRSSKIVYEGIGRVVRVNKVSFIVEFQQAGLKKQVKFRGTTKWPHVRFQSYRTYVKPLDSDTLASRRDPT